MTHRAAMTLRCILVLLLCSPGLAQAQEDAAADCWGAVDCYQCGVTRHIDGDTIGLNCVGLNDSYDGPLRLSGVDTPETGSRAKCEAEREKGRAAADYIRRLLPVGSYVQMRKLDIDRYGRWVGILRTAKRGKDLEDLGRDVGAELVWLRYAKPWAWRTPKPNWCD